jgi:hypothetical protein
MVSTAAAASPAEPADDADVGGIERHGQHDTPDRDRQEWANQDEGEIEQQAEDSEPDRQLDPGRGQPVICDRIVFVALRHAFPIYPLVGQ